MEVDKAINQTIQETELQEPIFEENVGLENGEEVELLETDAEAGSDTSSDLCVHHWMIERPKDGREEADCKKCGRHKTFGDSPVTSRAYRRTLTKVNERNAKQLESLWKEKK